MINSRYARVNPAALSRSKDIPASILADVAGRRGALDGRIRAVAHGMRLCGPAFTVEVRPGDNLMIHAALVLARPGDVLVIDGKADTTSALMGELMCAHAAAAGIAGIVIDGAVRDVATLRQGSMAVFACASNPNGPTRTQSGRIGHPISAGGVSVAPGDLVVGDDDGVVIVPRDDAPRLIEAAEEKIRAEQRRMQDINEGRLVYGWLEGALKASGALPAGSSLDEAVEQFRAAGVFHTPAT
ncbi:MAG TPA: RraA family protein [Burkholderiaceae bacterium]|nr:RraA family protein [Burkholderiaceae bacterium]